MTTRPSSTVRRPRWTGVALATAALVGATAGSAPTASAAPVPGARMFLGWNNGAPAVRAYSVASNGGTFWERPNRNASRQYWQVVPLPQGTVQLRNAASGTCVSHLTVGNPDDRHRLMRPCDGKGINQWWSLPQGDHVLYQGMGDPNVFLKIVG